MYVKIDMEVLTEGLDTLCAVTEESKSKVISKTTVDQVMTKLILRSVRSTEE